MAEKNSSRRTLLIIAAAAFVLLIASVVMLFFVSRKEDALRGADQAIRLSSQGGFNCEYAEAQKLYPFAEGVLKVTEERIAYLTMSGNEVFSTNISYRNPQCNAYTDRAVVFDVNGYSFTVVNSEGILYTKPTTNKIKAAMLSNNGLICAVITDNPESYGNVDLYDNEGNIISQWSSYNSGYPVSCVFSSDDSFLAVTTLNTVGAVTEPYVRLFSLSSSGAGTTVSDYGMYTINDSDIFGSVVYAGSRLYTFSSNRIYTIEGDSLVSLGTEYGVINNVVSVNDVVFVIYADGVDQTNKLAIIDTSGQTIYSSAIGSDVNAVTANGDRYAVSVDRRIYVYNRSGSVIADISVDEEILRMGFAEGNKLVIISTGGVHTVDY